MQQHLKHPSSDDVEPRHDDEGDEEGDQQEGDGDVVEFAADEAKRDAEGDADEVVQTFGSVMLPIAIKRAPHQ